MMSVLVWTVECRMTGDIGEGQLPLCLCHHIISSWDSPTPVDNRSSVITDNNGENLHYHLLLLPSIIIFGS